MVFSWRRESVPAIAYLPFIAEDPLLPTSTINFFPLAGTGDSQIPQMNGLFQISGQPPISSPNRIAGFPRPDSTDHLVHDPRQAVSILTSLSFTSWRLCSVINPLFEFSSFPQRPFPHRNRAPTIAATFPRNVVLFPPIVCSGFTSGCTPSPTPSSFPSLTCRLLSS